MGTREAHKHAEAARGPLFVAGAGNRRRKREPRGIPLAGCIAAATGAARPAAISASAGAPRGDRRVRRFISGVVPGAVSINREEAPDGESLRGERRGRRVRDGGEEAGENRKWVWWEKRKNLWSWTGERRC